MELWTNLLVSMQDDASIIIEKDGTYEHDADGNEYVSRVDVTIESSSDLYAAMANSMIDHIGEMYDDGTSLDYGEYWFVALCHGVEHGYCIGPSDVNDINDDGEVHIYPLGKDWDDDLMEALDRIYNEPDDGFWIGPYKDDNDWRAA